jgi:hypothetical protein
MKKFVLTFGFIFLSILLVSTSQAQITIGATGGLMFPLGDFGQKTALVTAPQGNNIYFYDGALSNFGYGLGIGGGLSVKFFLKENIATGINYNAFHFQMNNKPSNGGVLTTETLMPITVFGEYYFSAEKIKPYAGIELGALMAQTKVNLYDKTVFANEADFTKKTTANNTYFCLAPVVGCTYSFSERLDLNANIKYLYGMSKQDNPVVGQHKYDYTAFGFNIGISYRIMNKNKSFL